MSKQSTQAEPSELVVEPQHPRPHRGRAALVGAAVVVLVAGGLIGITQVVGDDTPAAPSGDTGAAPPAAPAADGPLEVSGSGVGEQAFGTDADEVVATLTDRYGEPDLAVGPERYFQIPGQHGWFEDAGDPISPSWQYPVASTSCWGVLCVVFGGEDTDALQLRGWAVAGAGGRPRPDVRLADSGIGLGDSWDTLHAAYPATVVAGGEGASLTVRALPWDGVFDGVGAWRLSGAWDYTHPDTAPPGAAVTRLSGGDGPEPGCC